MKMIKVLAGSLFSKIVNRNIFRGHWWTHLKDPSQALICPFTINLVPVLLHSETHFTASWLLVAAHCESQGKIHHLCVCPRTRRLLFYSSVSFFFSLISLAHPFKRSVVERSLWMRLADLDCEQAHKANKGWSIEPHKRCRRCHPLRRARESGGGF